MDPGNEKSRPHDKDGSPENTNTTSNTKNTPADREITATADLVAADCWAIAALDALAGVR